MNYDSKWAYNKDFAYNKWKNDGWSDNKIEDEYFVDRIDWDRITKIINSPVKSEEEPEESSSIETSHDIGPALAEIINEL